MLLRNLWAEARALSEMAYGDTSQNSLKMAVLSTDSYRIMFMQRMREAAKRRHVLGINHLLRVMQTAGFAIEIGNNVELGEGVYFVHSLGIVIGGDAKIGNRVKFMGNNTVGTAKDNGYPIIEDDVTIGAGARVLGPIRVGARSVIGANAVVLTDVPPDSMAVGIPAKIKSKSPELVQVNY